MSGSHLPLSANTTDVSQARQEVVRVILERMSQLEGDAFALASLRDVARILQAQTIQDLTLERDLLLYELEQAGLEGNAVQGLREATDILLNSSLRGLNYISGSTATATTAMETMATETSSSPSGPVGLGSLRVSETTVSIKLIHQQFHLTLLHHQLHQRLPH